MWKQRRSSKPGGPRGAASVEYLAIVGLVVIPLALCTPMLMQMIQSYSGRILWVIWSPLG